MPVKIQRFISVVLPSENIADRLVAFLPGLAAELETIAEDYEIVVVDNGSSDLLDEKLAPLLLQIKAVRIIVLSRHFEHSIAVSAGLDAVIGDYVVVLHPVYDTPAVIGPIVREAMAGTDILYGVNTSSDQRSTLYRIVSAVFVQIVERTQGIKIPENLTYLRCFSRRAVNSLTRIPNSYQYYRYFGSISGFKANTFSYTLQTGQNIPSRKLGAAIEEAIEILILNSQHPMRFVSLLGLVLAAINFGYIMYVIVVYLFYSDVVEGWTTMSLQISGLFMFVFIMLTVLSEYLGNLLSNADPKPSYFVKEELNSSVMVANQRINVVESAEQKE